MDTMQLRNRITEYATRQLISSGIDGLRVDDISSTLGISKKTLYQVFDSKTTLVKKCIADIIGEYKVRLQSLEANPGMHPVERFCNLIGEYIGFLYLSGRSGVMELSRKHNFSDLLQEMRSMWSAAFHAALADCGDSLPDDFHGTGFIDTWLGSMERARQREDSQEKAMAWARLTSRGIFKSSGIKIFDDHWSAQVR